MFDYREFEEVFDFNAQYSYDSSVVETIEANRRALEGLFVDRVLKLNDIKRRESGQHAPLISRVNLVESAAAKYYPPKSNSDLRTLHQAICVGNHGDHTKLSLLYYILLDCDAMTKRTCSAIFEERSLLPNAYQIFMKGLWHMDRLEFEVSLDNG